MNNSIITPAIENVTVENATVITPEIIIPERKILTLDDIKEQGRAKAIFAEKPADKMSDKYSFVPTAELIGMFENLGWHMTDVSQRGTKHAEVGKHMVKLENSKLNKLTVRGDKMMPQLIIHNSHNGSSGLNLSLGLFRFVCSNGLVVGVPGMHENMKFRHTGIDMGELKLLSEQILTNYETVQRYINDMQTIELTDEQRMEFAMEAIAQRDWYKYFDKNEAGEKVRNDKMIRELFDMDSFLKPTREEDADPTLWHTYNVIQEKLIHTSLERKTEKGRTTKLTPMKDIARKHRLNTTLWNIASDYMPEAMNESYEKLFISEETKNEPKERITVRKATRQETPVEPTVESPIEEATIIEETVNTQTNTVTETAVQTEPKVETKKTPVRGKNGKFVSKKQVEVAESGLIDFEAAIEDLQKTL